MMMMSIEGGVCLEAVSWLSNCDMLMVEIPSLVKHC